MKNAKREYESVSLITTERNEKDAIEEFISSVLGQSLLPDEIIIADGGSTDGTIEIIEKYIKAGAPIKLIQAPGNRSIGRNAATKAASHSIVVCTDVGSRLDKDWLKNITQPFRDKPKAMAVAGYFLPDPQTYFEDVSTRLMLEPKSSIDVATWLPSSRSVAYRKEAWEKVGGYPIHTNFNEDTPFDLALKKAGYTFEDGLAAIVYWRPRPNLREFYRQYYFYAVGDALDSIDHSRIVKLSAIYAAVLLIAGVLMSLSWQLFVVWLALVGLRQARRVYGPWRYYKSLKALVLMILLITSYDLSQMAGYIYGRLHQDRLRNSDQLVR